MCDASTMEDTVTPLMQKLLNAAGGYLTCFSLTLTLAMPFDMKIMNCWKPKG